MITLNITAETYEELKEKLRNAARANGLLDSTPPAPVTKRGRKKAVDTTEKETAIDPVEPEMPDEQEVELDLKSEDPFETPKPKIVTNEEALNALKAYSAKYGIEKVREILKQLKVRSPSDLRPDDCAKVLELCSK